MLVDTSVPVWQTLRKNLKYGSVLSVGVCVCVCMYELYVCMMSFRLIDDRVNMASPDDISYVSAGDIYSCI